MSHQELVAKFRDDRIGSGGALRATAGDKLFIKVYLFQNETPSEQNFKVWVKGRVSKALFDSVQLEDIGVVNKFENEEKQKICKDNVIEIETEAIIASWATVPKLCWCCTTSLRRFQASPMSLFSSLCMSWVFPAK